MQMVALLAAKTDCLFPKVPNLLGVRDTKADVSPPSRSPQGGKTLRHQEVHGDGEAWEE